MKFDQVTLLLFFIITIGIPALPQTREGKEHTSYFELTTDYFQNGALKSKTKSVCQVIDFSDSSGIPFKKIQWLSQITINGQDSVIQSEDALNVKAYHISVSPRGTLLLPEINVPSMTGAITDFNTFFVALHPKTGYSRLKAKGDKFMSPTPVKGDFSNGRTIIKGEDCIKISNELLSVNDSEKIIYTSFLPPLVNCLDYYSPNFHTPVVADTINNIQMIIPANGGKFNIQYGREKFFIKSVIQTSNDELVQALMTNDLNMMLQIECDSSYDNCRMSMPWQIYREVKLRKIQKSEAIDYHR